jgi:DNA primase
MAFDQHQIREVLSKTDLATLIGTYVQLNKRGRDLVGLCPFHGEKTPSFHVHPDTGYYKCFGCSEGGDAISFLRKQEGLTFTDALRSLAKRAGIELEPESPQQARARSERETIVAANQIAVAYFQKMLVIDAGGAAARAYCEKRGLDRATIDRFKLGFAPDRWDGLARELAANGIADDVGIRAGLLKQGQRGAYDFFRGRLMIPTYATTTGEPIAFGGRTLGADEPKYLNTGTTAVYTKGRGLYALDLARKAAAKTDSVIVVEGYLDCIALHVAGFETAIASLGTAFTPEQAAEIKRYAKTAFLCYDADKAGRAATAKALDILIAAGVNAGVLELPAGEDPDTYVRANGAEAFRERIAHAAEPVRFKLDRALAERDTFRTREELVTWAEQTIRAIAPQAEWDKERTYVAQRLGLNVDDLRRNRLMMAPRFVMRDGRMEGPSRTQHPIVREAPAWERDVVIVIFEEPALLAAYAAAIPAERFTHPTVRSLYERLVAEGEGLLQPSDVMAVFSDDAEALSALAALAKTERSSTVRFADTEARREFFERLVERFRADDERRRFRELDAEITRLYETGVTVPKTMRDEHAALAAKVKR